MFRNVRGISKGFILFGVGVVSTLIFERLMPMGKGSMITLVFILSIMVIAYFALCWPEFQNWWWIYKQSDGGYYPLVIESIQGVHVYLAKDHGSTGRFELRCDPTDKKRPRIEIGDKVMVKGKHAEKTLSGHITLINCEVRLQRLKPHHQS